MKPKIIHTKTFYCDGSEDDYDKHPRVHYTFDNKVDSTDKTDKGFVVCEYCYAEFVYEPKKKLLPLGDHWIPGVTERPTPKEEKTHSEEMQDKLEPIADRDDYVNRILKGSG
jgi:uncharacterized Zn-finger protein